MNATPDSARGAGQRSARPSWMHLRDWATLLVSLCVIGMIGILGVTHYATTLFSHVVSESPPEANPRTAAIVVESDPEHCRQLTFDNDTGQFSKVSRPCDQQNAPDAVEPVGTIRRLDAISKSFLGR